VSARKLAPPAPAAAGDRWLLLIHQLPAKPDYFRVKIWRRLQRIGAVAIKSSVYVLPFTDQAAEDFQWVRREVVAAGGEASVCQAAFVDGLSDAQIEALFRAQRDAEYAELALAAEQVALERHLAEIVALDHFGAAGRRAAESALARARRRRSPARRPPPRTAPAGSGAARGRTWVTRSGVHVDRIASAWLIRRFIDPDARFRFVTTQQHRPAASEQRFDMFEAEFTHDGDRCTFESLLARFGLTDPALGAIGEIVHDIDCKDGKFGRSETAGVERVIAGIVRRCASDSARVERGATVLDDLYGAFGPAGAEAGAGANARRPPGKRLGVSRPGSARPGPAGRFHPPIAARPALRSVPGRGPDQREPAAIHRTPAIGRGACQHLTGHHFGRQRPERRPLVAEPVARGTHRGLDGFLRLE